MRPLLKGWLLALFSLVQLATGSAFAQPVETIEVSGFEAKAQEQSNWCWAASIQALFLTKELEVDQADIVTAAYGRPVNATAPGFDGTLRLLNSVVVDVAGDRWRVRASAVSGSPDALWLLRRFQRGEPVMIWFQDEFTNHSIVLNGGAYYTSPSGAFRGWKSLTAYDPFIDQEMTINASNIPRYVYGTFNVSIHRVD
jgi:hypothetical protein